MAAKGQEKYLIRVRSAKRKTVIWSDYVYSTSYKNAAVKGMIQYFTENHKYDNIRNKANALKELVSKRDGYHREYSIAKLRIIVNK